MKTVVTISGIRPDFIRMSEVFKMLDANFRHILIHTGQHYDKMLSDVFFDELDIREPDYNLGIGKPGLEHFHQTAALSVSVIELLRKENINPDIILFLGDSNSVLVAPVLAKEGYKIGHIEAGMRSYDRRMLEEINRVVCDHVSDHLFVYHQDYAEQAMAEGIDREKIHVVGNTIVEVALSVADDFLYLEKQNRQILLDIHRPENFKCPERLRNIIAFAQQAQDITDLPIKMLAFGRTQAVLKENNIALDGIDVVGLMSYMKYMEEVYNSKFIISDSGTAQEEPAMLCTPVLVPRDYTERPQSMYWGCSRMVNVNSTQKFGDWQDAIEWASSDATVSDMDDNWLGDGRTSQKIIEILKDVL